MPTKSNFIWTPGWEMWKQMKIVTFFWVAERICNARLLFWAKIDMERRLEMINLKWHNLFQTSAESADAVAGGHRADQDQG